MLFDIAPFRADLPGNIRVFASGANQLSEIRGFAKLGIPVAVSANHLREAAIAELIAIGRPVLVDSGAFSEIAIAATGPHVVAEITDQSWHRRLAIYLRLATALGDKAMLVVPDQVGNQPETLKRLARYRRRLGALAATGARLLLPLQVGKMSHAEFYAAAKETAGVPLVPAMPMRKAATSLGALVDFLCEQHPEAIHLLGMGLENRRAEKVIEIIHHFAPGISISMDSNRLRAVIGRERSLTLCETKLRSTSIDGQYGAVESPVLALTGSILDYMDMIASPSWWASRDVLMEVAARIGLTLRETSALIRDPDSFLQAPVPDLEEIGWIEHPLMALELDRAWQGYVAAAVRARVRTAAIVSVFADSRLCGQVGQSSEISLGRGGDCDEVRIR
jgi:hypothetical protein